MDPEEAENYMRVADGFGPYVALLAGLKQQLIDVGFPNDVAARMVEHIITAKADEDSAPEQFPEPR